MVISTLLLHFLTQSTDDYEAQPYFDDDKTLLRASTAPARPLTEIEEFRRSQEFFLLEQSVVLTAQLIQKSNQKYDLDSQDGQSTCKKYLKLLEKLQEVVPSLTSSDLSTRALKYKLPVENIEVSFQKPIRSYTRKVLFAI